MNKKKEFRVWKFILGCDPESTAEMEIVEADNAAAAEALISDPYKGWGVLGSEEITEETKDWDNDFHRLFEKPNLKNQNYIDFFSKVKVGAKVKWNDPAIKDFDKKEQKIQTERIYEVIKIQGSNASEVTSEDDILLIADDFGEAEVPASEVEPIE